MKTTLIVIETEADYAKAMELIDTLMESSDRGSLARLQAQARLVEDYENACWPRKPVSLPDLLQYLMDQHGLSRADLAPLLGGASRVSEVLSGKRELSMTMVKRLRDRFRIPADLLIPSAPKSARGKKGAARSRRKTRGRVAA